MIKTILDTNVLISSIFWKGSPRKVVDLAASNRIKSFTSVAILEEVEIVLFEDFPELPYEKIDAIIRDILSYSQLVIVNEIIVNNLRDIKDTKILACAVSAKADYIVTGDKDLLVLKEYNKTNIVNPKTFLDILNSS